MSEKTGPVNPFQSDINARIAFLVALNRVQGLIEPVTKDKTNPHFKSGYASLAAVNEAIMGPLSENGFILLAGGAEIGGKPWLRTTLYHMGGHSESFDYPLLVNDDNPQHLASATTYARRYSLCAFFNLSTEDDDGNAAAKTTTRETASYVPSDAPKKAAAPAQASSDTEFVSFVPTDVLMVPGKGKGEGKMFSEIMSGNTKYSGDETQGQLALSAMTSKKEITIGFVRNGRYLNIKRGCVKLSGEVAQEIEEVPF